MSENGGLGDEIEDVIMRALTHRERRNILKIIDYSNGGVVYSGILGETGLSTGRLNYHLKELEGFIEKDEERRYLLTMTAGFDARDSYLYEWEGLNTMHDSPDALQYVLDLPVIEEPGTRFEYTNGVSHLLSCIITEKTGMSALEYGRERLFEPLGIHDVEWHNDSMGRNWGYNRIYITPHDMAKIGYLFLNKGQWDGTQIVPEEWVEEATTKHVDATIMDGYGYQWWVSGKGYYSAVGHKGQFIHVVPELDLVAVFTSRNEVDFDRILSLLETYVIPAVVP
jgi:CubicO group peptidase (beta-lactamase class C family)